jgi:hypothetical protein
MDDQGIERVESFFKIKLPEPYVRFLKTVPEGHSVAFCHKEKDGTLWGGFSQFYADPDWLIVKNLQLRAEYPDAYGTPWPVRNLAIADALCGDYDCLDVGENPTRAVLYHDHETGKFSESFPTFKMKVDKAVKPLTPKVYRWESDIKGEGLVVARTDEPWKSILNPIGLTEWERYVKSDPEMKLVGYSREGRNPFTGEKMRLKSPGFARWKIGPRSSVDVNYYHGSLSNSKIGGPTKR